MARRVPSEDNAAEPSLVEAERRAGLSLAKAMRDGMAYRLLVTEEDSRAGQRIVERMIADTRAAENDAEKLMVYAKCFGELEALDLPPIESSFATPEMMAAIREGKTPPPHPARVAWERGR